MKALLPRCALIVTLSLSACAYSPLHAQPRIAIGSQEPDTHSHAMFPLASHDITSVSAHVVVDNAIPHGLNYFAIQVNFPNETWAHGGLQLVSGKKQMNWGGLVNRGGGSKDYTQSSPDHDIALIQNPVGAAHTGPYDWDEGRSYTLRIERGKRVHLPPGKYQFISAQSSTYVRSARDMWEWILTIHPDGHPGTTVRSTLYNASPVIHSFFIWNECGYGACGHQQHATWSYPTYSSASSPGKTMQISTYRKF